MMQQNAPVCYIIIQFIAGLLLLKHFNTVARRGAQFNNLVYCWVVLSNYELLHILSKTS